MSVSSQNFYNVMSVCGDLSTEQASTNGALFIIGQSRVILLIFE